jgi:hypothetical protein
MLHPCRSPIHREGRARPRQGAAEKCPRSSTEPWTGRRASLAVSHGKRRQATKGGFASEREARQALNQALAAVTQSGYVEPTRLTVADYLDQ